MKSYPICLKRDNYRGANQAMQRKSAGYNHIVSKVESYINEELTDEPEDHFYQYFSEDIAASIDESSEIVHRIVHSIDGGSNAVTIYKGDYKLALENVSGVRE